MSDTNEPFKFAGFIVGMDTNKQTLLIRPSNIVVDENGFRYGVGIIDSLQGVLIKLEEKENFVKIKYDEKGGIYEKQSTIFLNRSKVWLTLQEHPEASSPSLKAYIIKNISWRE